MQNSSASGSVGSSSSSPAATTVALASSIPSITISRPLQKIPVIPLFSNSSSQGTSQVQVFAKKSSPIPIPPVIHTYSRPRILGRGRSPGTISQEHQNQSQTPPTTTNNSIAIDSTSTSTQNSTSNECELGFGKSLCASPNSAATLNTNKQSQSPSLISTHTKSISNSSQSGANIPFHSPNNANIVLHGVNVSPTSGDNVKPNILIGTSPPCKSPPASKLIVRMPSLSPVAPATSTESLPVAIPMQITDIQVVDEAEIENEVVQSVVQVEIDYQTLVALNDIEPAEEVGEPYNTIQNEVEEMEIDRTTAVLNVERNPPKPAEERTYVISQDENTQVINFFEIEAQNLLDQNEDTQISMEISEDIECQNEMMTQIVDDIDIATQQIVEIVSPSVHLSDNILANQVIEIQEDEHTITTAVIVACEEVTAQVPHEEISKEINIAQVAEKVLEPMEMEVVPIPNAEDQLEFKVPAIISETLVEQKSGNGSSISALQENNSSIGIHLVEIKSNENKNEVVLGLKNKTIPVDVSKKIDTPAESSNISSKDIMFTITTESILIEEGEIQEQALNASSDKKINPQLVENVDSSTKSEEKVSSVETICLSRNLLQSDAILNDSTSENVNLSVNLELDDDCSRDSEEMTIFEDKFDTDELENSAFYKKAEEQHIVPAEMSHNNIEALCTSATSAKGSFIIPQQSHSDSEDKEVEKSVKNPDNAKICENIQNNDELTTGNSKDMISVSNATEKEACETDRDSSCKALVVLSKEAQLSSATAAVAQAEVSPSDEIDMATETTPTPSSNQTGGVSATKKLSPGKVKSKSETVSSRDADEMVNTDTSPLPLNPSSSSSLANATIATANNDEGDKNCAPVSAPVPTSSNSKNPDSAETNTNTNTTCKKQSSSSISSSTEGKATLIPRIPIADEAHNNAEDETDKIVAAKVPVNEYEAQVVEPAEPEPANIRVVEQPPVIRCADLLDEPPDEIEIVGKAALQWRNGIGSLPGSNLKFKMNELGMMELIVQEDENENEVADMEIEANGEPPDDEEKCNGDVDKKEDADEIKDTEDQDEEEAKKLNNSENQGFESTEHDQSGSQSDRSGSRSPEYYLKPPPRAKFSIMSTLKNAATPAPVLVPLPDPSPEIKDNNMFDGDADIDSCLTCGRFGLKSELTDSTCTPCLKAELKKKKKTKPKPSPAPSQSESTSEENFKTSQTPYVPYKSIYPIIPRTSAATLKLQQLTETITSTMTNSAAIVLGIKDQAVMATLNAGIGLSCSKLLLESKAHKKGKKGMNSGPRKNTKKRTTPEALGKEMPHLGSPEKSSCDEKEGKIGEMPELKVNEVEFEWPKYLLETKSKAAPQRLFKQPAMPPENPFQCNMVLEAIDPQHQSLFCLVVVVDTQGYRMRLRFVGFSEMYDFWMNADSVEIFPCGWCEEHNYKVEPPPGASSPFDWRKYSRAHGYTVAPRGIFAILSEEPLSDSGVEVGMKLEAVDIRNQNLVCVATVANVMGDRFLVHFDSWDTLYDYWTDVTSPFIHPIGWCEENNVELTPPNNFKARFSWESYLRSTKCKALPATLFKPLPPVGFKKGMKLECVDKRNPFVLRVATISKIESHEFEIHFDNWPNCYDYKVYELSPDIHPVGWCNHTGHPLQSPPSTEGEWEGACKIFGCNGLGNTKGPKCISHNTEKYCPYSMANYKKEDFLTDRIVVFERNYGPQEKDEKVDSSPKVVSKKAIRKQPVIEQSLVVTGKRKRTSVTQIKEEMDVKPLVQSSLPTSIEPGTSTSAKNAASNSNHSIVPPVILQTIKSENGVPSQINLPEPVPNGQAVSQAGQSTSRNSKDSTDEPATKRRRMSQNSTTSSSALSTNNTDEEAFHSQDQNYHDISLKKLVDSKDESVVRKWKTKDVVDFVCRIPGCQDAAKLLIEHEIDGESFLMLTQEDLVKIMNFKMGPAIKLANAIRLILSGQGDTILASEK